jgi:S1-C subfamily serine protease
MRRFAMIVVVLLAAAVTLVSTATAPPVEPVYEPPLGPQTTERLSENLMPSVVDVRVPRSSDSGAIGIGTGVAYAPNLIITNDHVVSGERGALAPEVYVITAAGLQHEAIVVGRDSAADVAVLAIAESVLVPARFASSISKVRPGQRALAVGAPHTLPDPVATGPVTDITERVSMPGRPALTTLIESAARTVPGYSGGPLVNREGEVIGLTVGAIGHGTDDFRGYAIPVDQVLAVTRSIVATAGTTPAPTSKAVWRGLVAQLPGCPIPTPNDIVPVADTDQAHDEAGWGCTIWRSLEADSEREQGDAVSLPATNAGSEE